MDVMMKKYRVGLTEEEQEELKGLVSKGWAAAYKQTHARILLLSDENQVDGAMKGRGYSLGPEGGQRHGGTGAPPVRGGGLEAALGRKQQLKRRKKKLDGQGEAHLVALACSQPPEGRVSWTLQMLADGLVAQGIVDSISTETVRRTLKKTNSSLG